MMELKQNRYKSVALKKNPKIYIIKWKYSVPKGKFLESIDIFSCPHQLVTYIWYLKKNFIYIWALKIFKIWEVSDKKERKK